MVGGMISRSGKDRLAAWAAAMSSKTTTGGGKKYNLFIFSSYTVDIYRKCRVGIS
jgi:hypothetical protein